MTAENPNDLDARKWVANRKRDLRQPVPGFKTAGHPHRWTIEDFKLVSLFRDKFSRDELLQVLEIACRPRYDRRKDIGVFLEMMQRYIDGMGETTNG
jgi:hypothetical protein